MKLEGGGLDSQRHTVRTIYVGVGPLLGGWAPSVLPTYKGLKYVLRHIKN